MAPRGAIAAFAYGITPEIRRAISGWTVEWPRGQAAFVVRTLPPWLVVVGKLLRRGSIVPIGPSLERRLRPLLGDVSSISESEWIDAAHQVAGLGVSATTQLDTFDSDAERTFFEKVLPRISPPGSLGFWKRQVAVGSLTGDNSHLEANQRVDFLLSHPFRSPLVVEVDGSQHAQQREVDARRDALLKQFGIEVLRIPTSEVSMGDGPSIGRLAQLLGTIQVIDDDDLTDPARWLVVGRRIQQLQQVIVEAFEKGHLPPEASGPVDVAFVPDRRFGGDKLAPQILAAAIEDLNALFREAAGCQGFGATPELRLSAQSDEALCIVFNSESSVEGLPIAIGDSYFPASPELEIPRTRPFTAASVDRGCCERILGRLFGYESFREGQYEAIERALRGLDSLVLLPTGSGKSIAFQLASFLKPGVGIVVDPILSLIEDQIENLRAHGIDRAERVAGTQTVQERESVLALLSRTQYWLCYVAPERFQSAPFRDTLRGLTTNTPVSLVAVDEAHCVSEWGHDFRPAYLNLARTARDYCSTSGQSPPIMGLTGTASRSVLKDVQRELGITDFDAVIVPKSFDRKELSFEAIACRSGEKPTRLKSLLEQLPSQFGEHASEFFVSKGRATMSGLVFCPWVGGDHGIIEVGKILGTHFGISVPAYGSKPPKGTPKEKWEPQLRRTAEGFKRNRFPLMTCTKSFGMGIDKPNVRYTVHYNIPTSIEAFYQEAGRAGRDGRPAHCVVLYSDDFPSRTARLLNPAVTDMAELRAAVQEAGWDKSDDITRALFFHNSAFQGPQADQQVLAEVVAAIGQLDRVGKATLKFKPSASDGDADGKKIDDRKVKEQALHRLVVTGVVADYTIDYSNYEFHILLSGGSKDAILEHLYRYVAAYQRQRAAKAVADARMYLSKPFNEFVLAVCSHLITFVYEVIERGRRQALSEILRVCKKAVDGEAIRSEVLKYLQRSRFADQIDALLEGDDAGIGSVETVINEVRSFLDAAELRGECARELESYPDQPSLRLLRAVAEAMCQSPDPKIVEQNVQAAVLDGVTKYGLPVSKLLDAAAVIGDALTDTRLGLARLVVQSAARGSPDRRQAARYLLAIVRPPLFDPLMAVLVGGLVESVQELNRR